MYIDVHCHLFDSKFRNIDLDTVINNAKKAGVGIMVENGINMETNKIVLEHAKKYPSVKAALGFYPLEAFKMDEEQLEDEFEFIRNQKGNEKFVALGEIGLDNHWIKDQLARQKANLLKLIEIAERLNKPVIVHTRDAEKETIELLETTRLKKEKIVLHCFGGSKNLYKRAESNGWFFSIPACVAYSSHFQELAKEININQLLTETDSPLLSPFKDKNPINEPAFVVEAVKKIAELKKFEIKEVENNILMNYKRVFE